MSLKKYSLSLLFLPLILSFSYYSCTENEAKEIQLQETNTGVLVLAHGSRDTTWNNSVRSATSLIAEKYPVEIAFGMANPYSMQPAIDSLEAQGINRIVVVQLFVSSHSPIIRQNEFLLGLRDSLADAPMPPMAHEMTKNMHAMMKHDGKFELKPLDIDAEVILTQPLDDHPLVAGILLDRIDNISTDPSAETILLVAHGPTKEEDNEKWVEEMESLASQIRDARADTDQKFKKIINLTVRDDADRTTYDQAKQQFRDYVSKADAEGDALVVPLLLSKGGVERRYLTRLEGLNYTWTGETLLPHKNINKFIQQRVEEALQLKTAES